jgi:hypothetical protein
MSFLSLSLSLSLSLFLSYTHTHLSLKISLPSLAANQRFVNLKDADGTVTTI